MAATKQLSREEAASLYDKTLLGLNPDEVLEERIEEQQQHEAELSKQTC